MNDNNDQQQQQQKKRKYYLHETKRHKYNAKKTPTYASRSTDNTSTNTDILEDDKHDAPISPYTINRSDNVTHTHTPQNSADVNAGAHHNPNIVLPDMGASNAYTLLEHIHHRQCSNAFRLAYSHQRQAAAGTTSSPIDASEALALYSGCLVSAMNIDKRRFPCIPHYIAIDRTAAYMMGCDEETKTTNSREDFVPIDFHPDDVRQRVMRCMRWDSATQDAVSRMRWFKYNAYHSNPFFTAYAAIAYHTAHGNKKIAETNNHDNNNNNNNIQQNDDMFPMLTPSDPPERIDVKDAYASEHMCTRESANLRQCRERYAKKGLDVGPKDGMCQRERSQLDMCTQAALCAAPLTSCMESRHALYNESSSLTSSSTSSSHDVPSYISSASFVSCLNNNEAVKRCLHQLETVRNQSLGSTRAFEEFLQEVLPRYSRQIVESHKIVTEQNKDETTNGDGAMKDASPSTLTTSRMDSPQERQRRLNSLVKEGGHCYHVYRNLKACLETADQKQKEKSGKKKSRSNKVWEKEQMCRDEAMEYNGCMYANLCALEIRNCVLGSSKSSHVNNIPSCLQSREVQECLQQW